MKPATLFIFAPKNRRQYFNHTCKHVRIKYRKIHSFHSISFIFFPLHGYSITAASKRRDHEEDHCSHRNKKIIIKCSSKIVVVGWILELEIQDLFRSGSSSSSSSPHLQSERMNFFFFPQCTIFFSRCPKGF